MAALTEQEQKDKIASELGLPTDAGLIAEIDLAWRQYEAFIYTAPNLRYQYTYRDAIRWLLGQNWEEFNWVDQGVVQSDAQRFDHLNSLLSGVMAEIVRLEARAKGSRGAVCTPLVNTAPLTNPFGLPNPNSRIYRGDAVLRRGPFRPK